ncbi:hypothetical protein GCM10022214_26930 [Actinomadura miaoliensis]|uniref:Uncharacterized protein n=1 Tax=Actinomadura miaoliensis TaxID=430685 RepID=A0ABP7VMC0_9ACTN
MAVTVVVEVVRYLRHRRGGHRRGGEAFAGPLVDVAGADAVAATAEDVAGVAAGSGGGLVWKTGVRPRWPASASTSCHWGRARASWIISVLM